jgi:uncharacterized membrane protein YdjX (TVP38/TMEM64 family)
MKRITPAGWKTIRLFVLLFLFVASLALLTYSLRNELVAVVVWMSETIQEAPVWGAVIFFFASACSVLFLFLSSVLLVPSAILAWGKWPTFLILAAGWLCGWVATYAIGRFFPSSARYPPRSSAMPWGRCAIRSARSSWRWRWSKSRLPF